MNYKMGIVFLGSLFVLASIIFTSSPRAEQSKTSISAGDLIQQVILGKDFSGQKIVLSGTALTKTGRNSNLLNLGTKQVYLSGVYSNFISVYDTAANISKGATVSVLAEIERSTVKKLGKDVFVVIEASFIRCISC